MATAIKCGQEEDDDTYMDIFSETNDFEHNDSAKHANGICIHCCHHEQPCNENLPRKVNIDWSLEPSADQRLSLRYALNTETILCSVTFNKDGTLFGFSTTKILYIFETETGMPFVQINLPQTKSLSVHPTRVIRFSPDSSLIALGGSDTSVLICSTKDEKVLHLLPCHTSRVSALTFTNDGQFLLSGGIDGKLCVWDTRSFNLQKSIEFGPEAVIASIDTLSTSSIVVGFKDSHVKVYRGLLDEEISSFKAHNNSLLCVASNHFGTFATTSHDNTAKIWSLQKVPECQMTLSGHTDYVLTADFCSSTESVIFTGSKDETIRAWNLTTGNILFTLKAHTNTLFQIDHHPSAHTFVSCGADGIICVWDYILE